MKKECKKVLTKERRKERKIVLVGERKKNGMQKGILKGETKEIRKKKMKEKTK